MLPLSENVAVLRECVEYEICQLNERCDGHGGCKGVWEGVITFRMGDSPLGGVKYIRKVCHLTERCDAHGRIT